MKSLRLRPVFLLAMVLVTGLAVLASSQTYALKPPGPECGPTYQWICVVPNCPECFEVYFQGTICDKTVFELRTGRVCTAF